MKYIRRFNEELKASTYRSAGIKLKGHNKITRSKKLVDYADELEYGFFNMTFSTGDRICVTNKTFTEPNLLNIYYGGYGGEPSTFKLKNEEDLVDSWINGECSLQIIFEFGFKPTEETLPLMKSNSKRYFSAFSLRLLLNSFDCGLEEYNNSEDDEDIEKIDVYEFYQRAKVFDIFLKKPPAVDIDHVRRSESGIFSDRKSALRFKRILPKLIDPHVDKIIDILNIVGGEAEDVEKAIESFTKVRVNSLYYDEIIKSSDTAEAEAVNRWFWPRRIN